MLQISLCWNFPIIKHCMFVKQKYSNTDSLQNLICFGVYVFHN